MGHPKALTSRYGGYLVFTITVPPAEEQQADALVRRLSPGARLTYALGGTRKYELPTNEATLPGGERGWGCAACRISKRCGMSGKARGWEHRAPQVLHAAGSPHTKLCSCLRSHSCCP